MFISKKMALLLAVLLVGQTLTVGLVNAQDNASSSTNPTRTTVRQQFRQDQDIESEKESLKNNLQNLQQNFKNKNGNLTQATVTAINGSTLTVTTKAQGASPSASMTVNTSSATLFRRHFWGKSSLSEISVNNVINVWGSWTDSSHSAINARMIRNLSIVKRFGTFIGTVSSTSSSGFVLASIHRSSQTVTTSSNTKFVNRKQETITLADIKTGDRVRVKGMWDKTNNTITEVSQVKDFSLPVKNATATSTLTPTPSP